MQKFKPILSAILALALAVVGYAAATIYDTGVQLYVAARELAVNTFAGPVDLTEPSGREPAKRMQRAKSFVLKLVQRSRPTITPSWRFCSST